MDRREEEDDLDKTQGLVDGRVESMGNGLAMGWGPRLGAGVQAGLAKVTGGDAGQTYDTALRENRQVLDRARANEPKRAAALEMAGSIPTTIAAGALTKGVQGLGFLGRMRQALNTGGKLGLVAGAGRSNNDIGTLAHAADTVKSGVVGGLAGPLVEAAGTGAGALTSKLAGLLRGAPKPPPALNLPAGREWVAGMELPATPGSNVVKKAGDWEQELTDKVMREGSTWIDQATGFKHGPMSGPRYEDLVKPWTEDVVVPGGTDAEEEFFRSLVRKAQAPKIAATGTKVDRPSSGTSSTRNLNVQPSAFEDTVQRGTQELDPGHLRALIDALSKRVE